SDVDVDRYWINGDYRQVILAARELSTDSAAIGTSWVNRHLQYTHGYGLAMCLAAEKDDQGGPVFTVEDLPPRGSPDLKISRPEIYYGADMTNYQIVPTGLKEFDYPQGDQNVYTNYTGHGGILLDSFWKKLLLAWHQFDMSIVLSSYLSPQSRIQLWRPVQQRGAQLAPFPRLHRATRSATCASPSVRSRSLSRYRSRAAVLDSGRLYGGRRISLFRADE